MSFFELIQILLYGSVVVLLTIVVTLCFAGGVHFEPYFRKISSGWLPVVLLLAIGLSTLVSGRNVSMYGIMSDLVTGNSSAYTTWILRLSTATVVGISCLILASSILAKASINNAVRPLFLAFVFYFFATYVVSGILGTVLFISYKTFYPVIVVSAMYLTSDYDEKTLLQLVRDGLFIFLLLGLLIIPINSSLVMQEGYQGVIPGITLRYWGLASHANNIGPLALFFLLIMSWLPYKKLSFRVIGITVAAVVLVLAQSKTTFVAAFILATMFALRAWFKAVSSSKAKPELGVLASGCLIIFAVLVGIIFISELYTRPLEYFLNAIQGRDALFTGRENIWRITMAEWYRNPIFGYGPSLWGSEYSARMGYSGIASNAHNQILDVLGSAGIFGVVAFLIYFSVLCRYAIHLATPTKWISIALLVFIATRSVSEVPFKLINITTSDFFMHAVIVGLFMRASIREAQNKTLYTQQITP